MSKVTQHLDLKEHWSKRVQYRKMKEEQRIKSLKGIQQVIINLINFIVQIQIQIKTSNTLESQIEGFMQASFVKEDKLTDENDSPAICQN